MLDGVSTCGFLMWACSRSMVLRLTHSVAILETLVRRGIRQPADRERPQLWGSPNQLNMSPPNIQSSQQFAADKCSPVMNCNCCSLHNKRQSWYNPSRNKGECSLLRWRTANCPCTCMLCRRCHSMQNRRNPCWKLMSRFVA